jgi:RNA polymerase-binding protein DksA
MPSTEKLKALLLERLAELGNKVDEVEQELRKAPSPDWEDNATETEGDEVLEALENSALAEIQQIQRSLAKIDEGSYGICVTCGGKIKKKRLEALPNATQCIACARDAAA